MELQELLNKQVGTLEAEKLEPKPVKIATVEIQEKTKEGKEMKTPLAKFRCKHPDKEELIELSKVKFLKGDKLVTVGLWVQLDKEGNIQKSSALDIVLKHLKSATIADTFGKDMDTVKESDDSTFLCLKAY